MTDGPKSTAEEDFSLFDTEERVLADAEAMIRQLNDVARGVQILANAYRQSYREQSRLVRLSDRIQHELHTAKQKVSEQAQNLRALNDVLTSEVDKRVELSKELLRMATTDSLTGAVSRRQLFELGEYEISRIARTGAPLTALMIDFDHFKKINDTHGHLAGDEVLKHFAGICIRTVRTADVFARYGGEEFVILLPDTTVERAVEVAERLRLAVANEPVRTGAGEVPLTVSIGVASLSDRDASLESLLARADSALYDAKRQGRNCVVVHGDEAAATA
jgi:diguanylate cyclase (GGDEF)-like protein